MRGMLTAIFWMSPMPVPAYTGASLAECMTFLDQQCDAHGIHVSSADRQAALAQCAAAESRL